MEKRDQDSKPKTDLLSGLMGLTMFGAGIVGLIPALLGLFIVGGIAWYGVKFLIGLFGILFS